MKLGHANTEGLVLLGVGVEQRRDGRRHVIGGGSGYRGGRDRRGGIGRADRRADRSSIRGRCGYHLGRNQNVGHQIAPLASLEQ
ncbi:Collagen alpha 2(I) chain precursor [Mycobacterium marinum str. Europe]|nr:Collagen alpha 2(I) chain precursor [Mycobacterium marinum str. Europe]